MTHLLRIPARRRLGSSLRSGCRQGLPGCNGENHVTFFVARLTAVLSNVSNVSNTE